MTTKSHLALAAAAAMSAIVLAGCAAGAQSTASSPAASTPPASSPAVSSPASPATGAASASAAAHSSSSAAPAGGLAECGARQLRITYTDNSQIDNGVLAGMSHHDSVIMVTNTGSVSCTTRGYPGIALLDSAGRQVKQAVRLGGTPPTLILRPGGEASAEMQANSASCSTYPTIVGLLVTAPDQTLSTPLGPPSQPLCLNSVTVGWLVPGNGGGTGY